MLPWQPRRRKVGVDNMALEPWPHWSSNVETDEQQVNQINLLSHRIHFSFFCLMEIEHTYPCCHCDVNVLWNYCMDTTEGLGKTQPSVFICRFECHFLFIFICWNKVSFLSSNGVYGKLIKSVKPILCVCVFL